MLERADIQGLAFSGYAHRPFARCYFLRFPATGAATWLSRLIPRVTSAARDERSGTQSLNVAFSASGLRRLGLPEAAIATFPAEFQEGMAAPARASALGDVGDNGVEHWELGGSEATRIDAVVLVYATTEGELDHESATLEEGFELHRIESDEEDAYLPADGRGHFGFRDARSNPRLGRIWRRRQRDPLNPSIPYGEIVLGYRNASGHYAASPFAPVRRSSRSLPPAVDALRAMDLGRNGTYLALRKLAQDVAGFWRFAAQRGAEVFPEAGASAARELAEHLVGRTLDGSRVVGCPVGAHVRRANPRGDLSDDPSASAAIVRKHRFVRRGRLYGPKLVSGAPNDGTPRGLLFLALCADLARQFEYVHEAWLNNPKFGGLTHERDPLVGSGPALRDGEDSLSFPRAPYRHTIGIERFVRVRGGAYLFMPGLRALSYLAEG